MSIVDKIREYKLQYDEMDPYYRNQLHVAVIGGIVLIIALYYIVSSFEIIKDFFGR